MKEAFIHGSTWFRFDCHLHTKADKEFLYADVESYFISEYVRSLKTAGVGIGVVANHNKFDMEEFTALRKTAIKDDIFLLAGVELTVNDGESGIHTIVVFSNMWLENGHDYINQFLSTVFEGKIPAQYENSASSLNLIDTIRKLEGFHKDFFLIFAHVEEDKGLWKELGGGRLQTLGGESLFKRYVRGFQKVRTHDKPNAKCRIKVKEWLREAYPAEVEGSDPKSIEEIGRGKTSFIKVGAFTFEAVKFALSDCESRVAEQPPKITHSYIQSIEFTGGVLDGETISFSPALNALIGIRGSGKSSILEVLRYALGLSFTSEEPDYEYKRKLVERTLASGGKIVLNIIDSYGQSCQIRRIFKESINVYYDGRLQPGVSIQETVLHKPLFFGQKELAAAGKGSKKELIEKLLGTKCFDIQQQILDQKTHVVEIIELLSKIRNTEETIEEQKKIKQDAEFRLEFYKKHNLEEKLQKQLGFDEDVRKAKNGIALIAGFAVDIRETLAKNEDDIRNFMGYISSNNAAFFREFDLRFAQAIQSIDLFKAELAKIENAHQEMTKLYGKLIESRRVLSDEFAGIERALAEELKTAGENISSEEFLALKKKLSSAETLLAVLLKKDEQKALLKNSLLHELQKLNDLWLQEFQIVQKELNAISEKNSALKFEVGFKEDKSSFLEYFKNIFRGSGVRENALQNIVEKYHDFREIYSDLGEAKKLFGNNPETAADLFEQFLKDLLVYQPPNTYKILYRNTELSHHSLGQRASALILFVLEQRENDVVIIDQPEDDLDNQTIYEDVIKLLRVLKPTAQFILATHNPNIPVLGDAEQIFVCSSGDGKILVQSGGLDEPEQQKKIVSIMEGGKEAFEKRKEIYQIWKT
jgi:predicted ATPase